MHHRTYTMTVLHEMGMEGGSDVVFFCRVHSPASKQANKKSNASDGVSFSQTQSKQWKQIKKCAREKGHKVQIHMDSSDCYIYTCIVWFPCVSCKVMQGGLFLFPMGIQTIKGGCNASNRKIQASLAASTFLQVRGSLSPFPRLLRELDSPFPSLL